MLHTIAEWRLEVFVVALALAAPLWDRLRAQPRVGEILTAIAASPVCAVGDARQGCIDRAQFHEGPISSSTRRSIYGVATSERIIPICP